MVELIPDGIFDLCEDFPVNDKEPCYEEYFCIENYLISPNLNYIAIFVRRIEEKVGSHSTKEYIISIQSLINNTNVYQGEYIESELQIQEYFFSNDSKYLIHYSPTELLYIKLLGKQKIKQKNISSEMFLSCDSFGNINLLINDLTILIIQHQSDVQQIVEFQYEIQFFQKLFTNFAILESNNKTYIIHLPNQKILLRWNHCELIENPTRFFWKSFIVQGQSFANTLRNLQTGKIIRNIHPKFGFRQYSQDESSIYLFQIVKNVQKQKQQKRKGQIIFSRFDILRGVYKKLSINIVPFRDLQTFNNNYYIDYEDVEEVNDDEDKIKRLRYYNISGLTK